MTRIVNSFTGSSGDNALVDKTLGRSYDVVKEVYLKLPKLEELQTNPNVTKLVDNFDKVDEVLQNTDAIVDVGTNLNDILAAKMYSEVAQAQSDSASKSAESAANAVKVAQTTLDEAKQVKDDLDKYKTDIETVADNIGAVKNTSANITQINHLSSVFANDLTIPKIDAILNDLADITKVSDNITEVIEVANNFIGNGELDKIEAASKDIKDNLDEYRKILEDIKKEIVKAGFAVDQVQDKINEGDIQLTAAITLGEVKLNSILKDGNDLLKKIQDLGTEVEVNVDEANTILLKIRSLYHSYEEAIKTLSEKSVLKIQTASDQECLRIRKEAEKAIDRIDTATDVVTDDVLDEIKTKADEIKDQKIVEIQTAVDQSASQKLTEFNLSLVQASQEKIDDFNSHVDQVTQQKLTELQQKADELIAQIDAKLDEVKLDLTDITTRLTTVEDKVKVLEEKIDKIPPQGNDTSGKDIRFGYIDYSLPQNQDKMEVGTTYILGFDENHQYISISPDTNAFAKDPTYFRYYIKALSGHVSFYEKRVNIDLSGYLLRDELKQATTTVAGISELSTPEEVEQGTDNTTSITPKGLKQSLSKVLIKEFQANSNGLMNKTVQQIVKTIAGDRHLQEDLVDSMMDEIRTHLGLDPNGPDGEGGGGLLPPDGNINQDIIIQGTLTVGGAAEFDSTVTVPNQSGDITGWDNNVVLNKEDILKLIEKNKGTHIEFLDKYPQSEDDLEANVLYGVPVKGNVLELDVRQSEPTDDIRNNSIIAFDSPDLL